MAGELPVCRVRGGGVQGGMKGEWLGEVQGRVGKGVQGGRVGLYREGKEA